MALTLDSSGSYEPIADESVVVNVNGPKVFAAALNLSGYVGCELTVQWSTTVAGVDVSVWVDTFTVEVASDGYLSPPVPVYDSGALWLTLVAGTPTTPGIAYEVYAL